ncbi:MAG: caspase family protein [Elusimicrobia bacterium]|nr:caspase family protein [Elusimicrobiota bacterium]
MTLRPLLLLLTAASALTILNGCAPMGTVSNPVEIAHDPSSLVFAIPEGKRGGDPRRDDTASSIGALTGLQTVSLFDENDPRGADVIVRLKPGAFAWEIKTLSAHSRRLLTTGSASPFRFQKDLAKHLTAEFGPQTELYKRMMAEKREAGAETEVAAETPAPKAAPAASYRSDVESPSYRLPEDETKFALVVGVESYQSALKAEHAARDAGAVKAHLLAAGYPERNIVFLVDQQAGKSALEKYLEAWLPRNTDERSTVLFYFSGHGAPDPEKGQAYLMPWDADAKFTETTGYPVKRLYAKLNALKARRVLVAMDACFSGAGPRSVIGKGLRPLVSKIDDGGGAAGRVGALTASASDEMTGSDEASGHGLFTYHLLKALNARGGKATLKELFDALSPKVRDAARRDNRDQTPQLVGDGRSTL